jgi:predicted aldo/keto reductase-like oxidoreductase
VAHGLITGATGAGKSFLTSFLLQSAQKYHPLAINDPEKCYASDGVLEALSAPKQQGKVRFVGFTGHKNPALRSKLANKSSPWSRYRRTYFAALCRLSLKYVSCSSAASQL